MSIKPTLLASAVLIFFTTPVFACTTVFSNTNAIKAVARTTDLYISDQPLLKVQPRGMSRSGEAGEHSHTWKSKYGNVVVTAFGSNAVTDGMNEKGLAVHLLYLSDTEYPKPKEGAPQVSNLLWSQYMLDNFATVSEALAATKDLQVVATKVHGRTWPIHLTMEDPSGDSAVIEYVKGKMNVYHGHQYRVMTNEPAYNIQLENVKKYKGFGGNLSLPGDSDPLSRFVRSSVYLKTLPTPKNPLESIANVLSVIRTAMVPFGVADTSDNGAEDVWPTRWVSVADLTNKVYYFNSTSTPNIIWLDLKKLNFAENAKVLSVEPTDIGLEGDIAGKMK